MFSQINILIIYTGGTIGMVIDKETGSLHPVNGSELYELGRIGVISGLDITTESALAKLMYLFGTGLNRKEVENLLRVSLRGEITVS